jgi:uncharacterized protein YdeI (YjbR/CyaY-like superfamily)
MVEAQLYQAVDQYDLHRWFEAHYNKKIPAWIVLFKKTGEHKTISMQTIIEEALCYGWIDSKIKKIDEDRYAVYLSPRKPTSHWTETNKRTAERLITVGRMQPSGLASYRNSYTERHSSSAIVKKDKEITDCN